MTGLEERFGSHGTLSSQVMQRIAQQTGGKYYVVSNAKALPKIYQREARRIARPLVFEPSPPVSPQITSQHEIVQGLENAFPPGDLTVDVDPGSNN